MTPAFGTSIIGLVTAEVSQLPNAQARQQPNQTPEHIVRAIVEARQRHPSWGARKLLSILEKRHANWPWPARSTVCDILSRHGLVPKQRYRR